MDLKDIRHLIRLVDEKKFAEFELEKGDFRLRIRRNEPPVIQYQDNSSGSGSLQSAGGNMTTVGLGETAITLPSLVPSPERESAAVPGEPDLHLITSPIVGTFYRAPSPTSNVFVEVGDRVQPGTITCIVEAMKLMNEIPSDVSGEVVRVFVENAQPVEYGQPLFGIRIDS